MDGRLNPTERTVATGRGPSQPWSQWTDPERAIRLRMSGGADARKAVGPGLTDASRADRHVRLRQMREGRAMERRREVKREAAAMRERQKAGRVTPPGLLAGRT